MMQSDLTKRLSDDTQVLLDGSESPFTLTPSELSELNTLEALEKVGGVQKLAASLRTDLESGVFSEDLHLRKKHFGENRFKEAPHASWFQLFFEALQDVAVVILLIAAGVSFVAGIIEAIIGKMKGDEWLEGATILVAVLIVATVTATNDYLKDVQFRELKNQNSDRKVRVMRAGKDRIISIFDVTVGDIVILFAGDAISADAILITETELQVNESILTGEAEPKRKRITTDPFLLSGCTILNGVGKALVISVGMNSVWGQAVALIPDEQPPTPLQDKLEDLVTLIGKIGLVVATLVFIVLAGYYIYDSIYPIDFKPCTNNHTLLTTSNGTLWNCSDTIPLYPETYVPPGKVAVAGKWETRSLVDLLNAFIVAVTIVVVAVPEGLPLAVTISLAYSMKQMSADKNFVRHLAACETMGGATNICSDKTGTLTRNMMNVRTGTVFGSNFKTPKDIETNTHPNTFTLFLESISLNILNALLIVDEASGSIVFNGNVTECALLLFIRDYEPITTRLKNELPIVFKKNYDSSRKMMSTVVKHPNTPYRVYSKGAPEIILEKCSTIIDATGSVEKLEKDKVDEYIQLMGSLGEIGYRTIAIAYRDLKDAEDWESYNFEQDLTFIGILGIEDPVRPEVPDSVLTCRRAGITVRMITGDNIKTAIKIAKDCHILPENYSADMAITGQQFDGMSDGEVIRILPTLMVLARASPNHKFRLVSLLQQAEEVVAVTGDGTNDAPALSRADVGLAMGITGTDVAKHAADIIIEDDNFASIVKSVSWGRTVFENVRKFLQFQMTVNVAALAVAFIGAVTGYGTPLNAIQLLWVNLIMDTLAALALGTGKPTPDLLLRKPYGRAGKLITTIMWKNIIGQAILQIGLLCFLLYGVDKNYQHVLLPGVQSGKHAFEEGEESLHYTVIFNTFVFCQIFNEFNCRTVNTQINVFKGLFDNFLFCVIMIVITVIQVVIIQFGGKALKTVALPWDLWLISVGLAFITIPLGFILRLIPVHLEEWEKTDSDPTEHHVGGSKFIRL